MWQGVKSKLCVMERLDEILNFLEERGYLRIKKVSCATKFEVLKNQTKFDDVDNLSDYGIRHNLRLGKADRFAA